MVVALVRMVVEALRVRVVTVVAEAVPVTHRLAGVVALSAATILIAFPVGEVLVEITIAG